MQIMLKSYYDLQKNTNACILKCASFVSFKITYNRTIAIIS